MDRMNGQPIRITAAALSFDAAVFDEVAAMKPQDPGRCPRLEFSTPHNMEPHFIPTGGDGYIFAGRCTLCHVIVVEDIHAGADD